MIGLMYKTRPVTYSNVNERKFNLTKTEKIDHTKKICICENKDADQLRGNREADQRLCFRYIDGTIPLLYKSEISSLYAIFCDCLGSK